MAESKGWQQTMIDGKSRVLNSERRAESGPWRPSSLDPRCLVWGVLGVLWLAVLGCGSESMEEPTIRLGVITEVTISDSERTVRFFENRVRQTNAAGGVEVNGVSYPLSLYVEDSEGTPEGSARAALRLINTYGVVAMIGPNNSRSAIPVAEVAQQAAVPMISAGSTHPETTAGRPFVFRIPFTDPVQGQVLAQFAVEELGAQRVAAFFNVANDYSRDIAADFKFGVESLGGSVVAYEGFTVVDGDVQPALQRLVAARPEVLFLPSRMAAQHARGFHQLGGEAVLLGSDIWNIDVLSSDPLFDGAYVSQRWHGDLAATVPKTRELIATYQEWFGLPPTDLISAADDALGVLLEAIRNAERVEPEAIRKALAGIEDFQSTTGPLTFRGTDGDPTQPVLILQFLAGRAELRDVVPHPGPSTQRSLP